MSASSEMSLREKIDKAKRILPLPELMDILGYAHHARKTCLCPFHEDKKPSFSVFQASNGVWLWKCFSHCGQGDEIEFLQEAESLTKSEAIHKYLSLAEERGASWKR